MATMSSYDAISRRALLCGIAGCAAASGQHSGPSGTVRLRIEPQKIVHPIPSDFMGLGYEISSVSEPGLFTDPTYVRLVRALSPSGLIRIGGNTSDYASWAPDGPAVSSPKSTVVDLRGVRDLGAFLRATGWRLIWGFNLGRGSVAAAVEEAIAVSDAAGHHLLAFEIGNEPDLFPGVHRPQNYSYSDYSTEYQRFKKAIRAKLPSAPFAGPDVIVHADWFEQFASSEAPDIKLLTYHFYAEGPPDNPASTIDTLLKPNPFLPGLLTRLDAAARSSRLPYRIVEANSCFGGGKPGVSDTLAAALWGLDFMFTLAQFGCSGINMQTGVNHLGFLSYYTPLGIDSNHRYAATPIYQGMLAFALASRGNLVQSTLDPAGLNLTAYAVRTDRGETLATVINKESARDAHVRIACPGTSSAQIIARLSGPSLSAKDSVRLDHNREPAHVTAGELEISVPAASAAILLAS
jgi:hypothetical protein